MAVSRDEFIALVKRLEAISKKEPAAYRRRLGLLAVLGYAFIFGVLLAVLGSVAGIIAFNVITERFYAAEIKVILFLVVLAGVILRSLWVKVEAPKGIPLRRGDVPELFRLIDDLSRALKAPRIDRVLLTGDFNAAVAQIPRLGVFGWHTNYLLLGYPLLQSLSPEQFRAVLAHEMGHLSEQHGRFGVWIWRLRETWGRLMADLQGSHNGMIFNWFLRWYGPYFMAYSFVLARADEYQADRRAGEIAGTRAMVEGLVATHVRDTFLDRAFWAKISEEVQVQAAPPSDPFTRLTAVVHQPMPADDARKWLALALAQTTDYDDTHPALRERVAALGFPAVLNDETALEAFLPVRDGMSAAESCLGAALLQLTAQLDRDWATRITPLWKQRHEQAQQGLARLQALTAQAERGEALTREESWERAKLTAELHDFAAARPLLDEILAAWPDFAPAKFALGQTLLEAEDEAGMAHIGEAMDADPDFVLPGCQLLYGYLKQRGRDAEAEPYLQRGMQRAEVLQEAEADSNRVTAKDRFQSPELPDDDRQALLTALAAVPEVRLAYLARKIIPAQPERVCHVLAVKLKHRGMVLDEGAATKKVLTALMQKIHVASELLVVIVSKSSHPYLEKLLNPIPGTLFYQK